MRTIESLFREFLNLSYKWDPDIVNNQIGDVYISDLVILRKTKISWDFIILTSGEMISIPYEIIDIFKSFDVYSKGVIFGMKANLGIEIFIQFMLAFVHSIEEKNFTNTLEGLKLLQELGTKDFIGYLESVLSVNTSLRGVMCISKKNLTTYL